MPFGQNSAFYDYGYYGTLIGSPILEGKPTGLRGRIRNKSAPIQLSQCRFPLLAISNGKILVRFFSKNKIYGSSFIKQHSETDMVWNYQNTDCSLREKNYCVIYYNFRHTFVPYRHTANWSEHIIFAPIGAIVRCFHAVVWAVVKCDWNNSSLLTCNDRNFLRRQT